MPYSVTQEDILSVTADAAVICVENRMVPTENPVSLRLAEAGGEAFQNALRQKRFLPVGSAWEVPTDALPFRHILAVACPHWWNGESGELYVLRLCYESIYSLAGELGLRTVAMPFLSAMYYHYPQTEAVNIARTAAEQAGCNSVFVAETPELYAISQAAYRRPEIVRYVGYYGDYGVFLLDNGLYARVDLRPEMQEVQIRRYVAPCYFMGTYPDQVPLPDEEIRRLRDIYDGNGGDRSPAQKGR